MAVIDSVRRAGPLLGNGLATELAYDFKLLDESDVRVTATDADGVTTTLSLGNDYTLTGVGADDGGSILLTVAPPTGTTVWAVGDAPYDQKLTIFNQGPYFAEDVMRALDRAVVLSQQLREALSRALVIPVEDGVFDFGTVVEAVVALAPHADAIAALGGVIAELELLAGDLTAIINAQANADAAAASAVAAAASETSAAGDAATAAAALAALNAKITISTLAPSGGSDGDIWFRVQ